jgi:Gametolysin peptidase M11
VNQRRRASLLLLAGLALAAPPTAAATTSYRGKLEIRHTDDFKRDRSTTRYTLIRGRHRTRLALGRAPRIASGSAVVVNGRRAGSVVKGSVRPLHALLRAASIPAGPRKTAVILVKPASATEPWSSDYVRQRIFTDPDSTSAFYAEDSYGAVSLVGKDRSDGDVYGWYDVAGVDTCDVNAIAENGQAAAAADGFSAAGYQHVIYAFPYQSSCGGWAGLGELPGNESWMNGYIEPWVVAHELGHNMGLHHASTYTCTDGGTPVSISANCSSQEYGDLYDVMGDDAWHNNAWHLRQIGFLDASNVQTVTANGTYTINSTATHGGIELLRIRRPDTSLYYDLSLRSASGVFDTFASSDPVVQGLSVHMDPDPSVITQSLLIDTTPGSSGGFYDAALTPGRTFTDGDVSITTQSVVAGVATVQVTVTPAPPADTTPPSAPGPLVADAATDHVTLSWPPASDGVGVAGYRVFRDGGLVESTTQTGWTDTSVTAGATYGYRVEAYDGAGNAASSAVVSATVPSPPPPPPPPPAEASAPLVAIASPGRHARLRRRAIVRAAAADHDGKVARTEVWIDGKLHRRVAGGRLDWRWSLRHVRRGIHRVTVRAIDAAGNAGKASVRVRVVR